MKHVLNALVVLAAIFAPAKGMILASLALIVLDLITGLIAAKKQQIPITSGGIRRTVTKLFVYESAILIGFIAQHYLMADSVPVASIISGFIGMTETLSCLENINIIGGSNLLKALLDKLNSQNK